MGDENKVTAAEIRAQQQEHHHQKASEALATSERNEKAEDERQLAEKAERARVVEQLRGSWNATAQRAAEQEGVRFVVLVDFAGPYLPSELEPLVKEIEGFGYQTDTEGTLGGGLTASERILGTHSRFQDEAPGGPALKGRYVVMDGHTRGWRPARVPIVGDAPGRGVRIRSLVVIW